MKRKIEHLLVLSYIAFFSFGQLPSIILTFLTGKVNPIHIADLAVLCLLVVSYKLNRVKLITLLIFSQAFALSYFNPGQLIQGLLYLIRFLAYLNLGFVVYKNRKHFSQIRTRKILITLSFLVAAFGIVQYLFIPDMRPLAILGWDDHFYRLVGTHLDPTFTGIIIVFGTLISLDFVIKSDRRYIVIVLILAIALLLTYSRSSYLALIFGAFIYFYKKISLKVVILGILLFVSILFLLPRGSGGEGVHLERTFSITLKAKNTRDGILLFLKSPLFGYGYNNVCQAQIIHRVVDNSLTTFSNSCSGLDNSLVLVLVTTGIVGFIFITKESIALIRLFDFNKNRLIFAVLGSVILHGQFTNTLFYPWVMGYLAILLGSSIENKKR